MANVLDNLRGLGYTVAPAFGDVEPELQRRDELAGAATPPAIAATAERVAADVAAHLRAQGTATAEIIEIVSHAAAEAIGAAETAAGEALAAADQAVAEAEAMPTVLRVSGWGIELYVTDDDADTLKSLADPKAHAERRRQFEEGQE